METVAPLVPVVPTFIGSLRVFRTPDGRLLSQQHLDARPDQFCVQTDGPQRLESRERLAISA
jgi:hypothetical protein